MKAKPALRIYLQGPGTGGGDGGGDAPPPVSPVTSSLFAAAWKHGTTSLSGPFAKTFATQLEAARAANGASCPSILRSRFLPSPPRPPFVFLFV